MTKWGRSKRLESLTITNVVKPFILWNVILKALADGNVPLKRLGIGVNAFGQSVIEFVSRMKELEQITFHPSELQLRQLVENLTDLSEIVFEVIIMKMELADTILQRMHHFTKVSLHGSYV